jgi:hypothetical protein
MYEASYKRVGLRFTAPPARQTCRNGKGGEAMSEILQYFVNEFYVFTLAALGMVLAYMAKRDKQDKNK